MKSNEFLNEATMDSKVGDIVDALNKKITNDVKSRMTSKRLTMLALKDEEVRLTPVSFKTPSSRVWTRGDGSRYRDPGYIKIDDATMRYLQRTYSTFKKMFPTAEALLDHVWETLKTTPRSKDLGTISGEFRSDDYAPALRAGGMLWVNRERRIEYGSMSRLTNKNSVWHNRPPEDETPDEIK
jgi:hypothetical protein